MNAIMSRGFVRFVAGPVAAAGILGGAAFGLAAVANATPTITNGTGSTAPSSQQQPMGSQSAHHPAGSDGGGLMRCVAYGCTPAQTAR